MRENLVGAGIRQGSGACKHCFQFLISVYQVLVTLGLVNFDSFTSTLTLHTWLQTNMVSVCNLPSPHILVRETVFLEVGGLRHLKRCLQVLSISLAAVFRSLTFLLLARFLRSSALTESMAQAKL